MTAITINDSKDKINSTNAQPFSLDQITRIAGPVLFYTGIALTLGGLGAFTYFSIGAPWRFLAVTLNPFRGDLMLIQIYVGNIIHQLLYSAATTVVGSLTAYAGYKITHKV